MTEKSNQEEFRISSTMWFDLVKSVAVLAERVDAQTTAINVIREDVKQVRDDVRFCFKLYVGLIAVLGGAVVVQVVGMFFA